MTATTEPVAGDSAAIRHQIRVLDIAQGFFQSTILSALLKLRIFEHLDGAPSTGQALAAKLGVDEARLVRLLTGGVMLKLLELNAAGEYALTAPSRAILAPSAGENYLGNWLRNLDFFYQVMPKLGEAVVQGGPLIEPYGHLGGDPALTREFELAMHNYAALRGKELAAALDTTGCRSMLDVGCGPGTLAFLLGQRNPGLELNLFDLPPVLAVTAEVRDRYGLPNKVNLIPGNALADTIPGQYDLVLVSNILHMLGERPSRELLKRLYQNVRPGGSLVVQGMYYDEPEAAPQRWPVCVDLLQMVMTAEGRNHTVSETRRWLTDAGFARVEYQQMTIFSANSFLRGYRE